MNVNPGGGAGHIDYVFEREGSETLELQFQQFRIGWIAMQCACNLLTSSCAEAGMGHTLTGRRDDLGRDENVRGRSTGATTSSAVTPTRIRISLNFFYFFFFPLPFPDGKGQLFIGCNYYYFDF
jgi:hypothetical protein